MWDKTPDQLDPATRRLLEIHLAQANGVGFNGGNHGTPAAGGPSQDRPQRTVYVGNVKPEISEHELGQFLNQLLTRVPGRPSKPGNAIVDIAMKYDRAYAFVEFRDSEDADICIALDGAQCKGIVLRLRRTNNYHPPPGYDEECKRKWRLQGVIPTHVEDGPNKLYFSGLPKAWNEEAVIQIVQQAGELGAFTLVRDKHSGESKGYAFFSFRNPAITDQAIQFLNSLNIPDTQLLCKRARVPGQPMGDFGGAAPPPAQPSSRILVLGNMVTGEELQDDAEYTDIMKDVHQECEKHGAIDRLIIPRPGQSAELVGRIYLAFQQPESAQRASQFLAGRTFNDKRVTCSFVSEQEWADLQRQFP